MNLYQLYRPLNTILFFAWTLFGVFALYVHNNMLPYLYFIFILAVIIAHAYLYCTRCAHYGEKCNIYGGLLSKTLFKKRASLAREQDDSVCASLWLLVALFPVPFLLYYMDWLLVIIFVSLMSGWLWQHGKTACSKCQNNWCILNKNK